MQNPNPRTFAQLTAILDARSDASGIKRLEDALPDLSGNTVIHRAPNAKCMEGFSPRHEAVKIEADICNHD